MKSLLFLVSLICIVNLSCKFDKRIITADLVITNVTVIDALNGVREHQDVFILDGKICEITHVNSSPTSTTNLIDAKGKFLIPGLWDTHIHMAYDTLLSDSMFGLFLRYGITYIRDTGGKISDQIKWKKYAQKNPNESPNYYFSGPLIDGVPTIYDGSSSFSKPLGVGSGDPKEIASIANGLVGKGVHFLKAYEMLDKEGLMSLTEVARQNKLKVTGHVPLGIDIIEAIDIGLNSIEHLRNIELACSADWEALLEKRLALLENKEGLTGMALRSNIHAAQRTHALQNQDEQRTQEVLNKLLASDIYQIPTLSIMTAISKRHWLDPEFAASFKYVPDTVANRWKGVIPNFTTSPPKEKDQLFTDWLMSMTNRMQKKGIPIMAGTDSPIFFLTPGYSLHTELALLVESGLSTKEALASATLVPAQYFGMEDQIGTISKGMQADLVLLNANPLEDISNTTSINKVFKNGQVVHSPK